MKILVTGGCGYIGSHTIVDLAENGFDLVSADSLVRATAAQLKGVARILGKPIKNHKADLCDKKKVNAIFEKEKNIVGVIHFAALKSVGESVHEPALYYRNNLDSLLNVLEACVSYNVPNFIFSSSCSVYGNTDVLPVTETTPLQKAESPYGHTKQIGEGMIEHFTKKYASLNAIILRYFNPAGAHPSGLIGENSWGKPIYLTPVMMEVMKGNIASMTVFGNDYDTRDGSCVRDFIHVMDLAKAHTACLNYLKNKKNESNFEIFNVGIGEGVTVLEAINAYEKVTGQKLNYTIGERRAGDVIAIYSNYKKAAEKLGWQPQYGIEDIMQTAVNYENKRAK
jgi:UDP-glucose 4-epimerase